ncbi:hypothetical protein D9547_16000, partial [Geobacillus stearothermophilus]
MTFAFFYRASLGGPDERREQKFATLVGESFLNVTHKYFTHTADLIPRDNMAHVVHEMVERIPMETFLAYYKGGGASAYHPKMM